jgi:hypothetical protein
MFCSSLFNACWLHATDRCARRAHRRDAHHARRTFARCAHTARLPRTPCTFSLLIFRPVYHRHAYLAWHGNSPGAAGIQWLSFFFSPCLANGWRGVLVAFQVPVAACKFSRLQRRHCEPFCSTQRSAGFRTCNAYRLKREGTQISAHCMAFPVRRPHPVS